jgi:hypothetical protein
VHTLSLLYRASNAADSAAASSAAGMRKRASVSANRRARQPCVMSGDTHEKLMRAQTPARSYADAPSGMVSLLALCARCCCFAGGAMRLLLQRRPGARDSHECRRAARHAGVWLLRHLRRHHLAGTHQSACGMPGALMPLHDS